MQCLPFTMGNPVMKSIDMLSHFPSGMGRGCNNPAGWLISLVSLANIALPDMLEYVLLEALP